MKCVICKTGETALSETTVTFEKNGRIVVFRGVPAQICTNCGEEYVDEATTRQLYDSMNSTIDPEDEVTLRIFEPVGV